MPTISLNWPVGSSPTISWSAPAFLFTLDHFRVLRNTVPTTAGAVDVSGSLSSATASFTDGSVPAGVNLFYWFVVGYNATQSQQNASAYIAGSYFDLGAQSGPIGSLLGNAWTLQWNAGATSSVFPYDGNGVGTVRFLENGFSVTYTALRSPTAGSNQGPGAQISAGVFWTGGTGGIAPIEITDYTATLINAPLNGQAFPVSAAITNIQYEGGGQWEPALTTYTLGPFTGTLNSHVIGTWTGPVTNWTPPLPPKWPLASNAGLGAPGITMTALPCIPCCHTAAPICQCAD